jgi:hypothetical protein
MTDDGVEELEELVAAFQARAAHRRTAARAERERDELGAVQLELQAARARLDDETQDVERLESFSPTRIWAGLRGQREADLERERAEQLRAQYEVASAEASVARALEQLQRSESERAALGEVDERWDRALAGLDTWLGARTGEQTGELRRVAQQLAEARREVVEIGEARSAAAHAAAELDAALTMLGKASDWAAWDTFGGGGMITDAFKYDRMDQAAAAMREADRALKVLAGELADIGLAGTGGISVDAWTRAFDVWFDNIFSDWAVRDRIRQARQRTEQLAQEVAALRVQLGERDAQAGEATTRLEARQVLLAASLADSPSQS